MNRREFPRTALVGARAAAGLRTGADGPPAADGPVRTPPHPGDAFPPSAARFCTNRFWHLDELGNESVHAFAFAFAFAPAGRREGVHPPGRPGIRRREA